MNITMIKVKPEVSHEFFKDYPLPMAAVIEEPSIKNWIENLQNGERPEVLKERLLKEEGAHLRVRHDENGNITEMLISQYWSGALCCMHYSKTENWARLIDVVNNQNKSNGGIVHDKARVV